MADSLRVIAGECTVREQEGPVTARERRGRVVVIVKPDDTVLVHDTDGYQPVAWLTRADGVTWEKAEAGTAADGEEVRSLTAHKDRRLLVVTVHDRVSVVRHDATAAGEPIGNCRCEGPLVRADGRVRCLDCGAAYGLPRDATVLAGVCDCRLPQIAVERGRRFDLCLDRGCTHSESMDEAVRTAFDREWTCPECGADLRVIRRGGLMLGCERYPSCETGYAFPTGTLADDGECHCDCGLPVFETGSGWRCVDSTCEGPFGPTETGAAGADAGSG